MMAVHTHTQCKEAGFHRHNVYHTLILLEFLIACEPRIVRRMDKRIAGKNVAIYRSSICSEPSGPPFIDALLLAGNVLEFRFMRSQELFRCNDPFSKCAHACLHDLQQRGWRSILCTTEARNHQPLTGILYSVAFQSAIFTHSHSFRWPKHHERALEGFHARGSACIDHVKLLGGSSKQHVHLAAQLRQSTGRLLPFSAEALEAADNVAV